MEYGGTAIALNQSNHSLFLVGHDWCQLVAEVEIPEIRESDTVDGLATARLLQDLSDPSEGLSKSVDTPGNNIKVGGMLTTGNNLLVNYFSYYDNGPFQEKSVFRSGQDLSESGDVQGPYAFGDGTLGGGFFSGYLGDISRNWSLLLGGRAGVGQCCLAIISRTSYGPSLSSFNPPTVGGQQDSVDATPLLYYPSDHPLDECDASFTRMFNCTAQMAGFVSPNGWGSLLFFGVQGRGRYCYGTGGTDRSADCYDPYNSSKGTHAYPYVYQVWEYRMRDFLAVKRGKMQPWEPRPSVWRLNMPFTPSSKRLGGVAYDAKKRLIYVSQMYSDSTRPLVHVYKLARAAM